MPDFDNVSVPQPGAATSTPEPTPAPATQGAPTPQAPQATPSGPAQPGATPGGHEAMVPSYRLREIREQLVAQAQAEIARREAEWQRQVEERDRKLQALVGVVPQQTSEEDAIRSQFAKLFPHLGNLTQEKIAQLEALLERSGDLEAQNSHYWQTYGQQAVTKLFSLAEADLGGQLSDMAKRNLHASFIGYLQSDPELVQRYASDPNFVTEFWKAFSSSFIDPVRRGQAAGTLNRAAAAVPQDTPSGAVRVGTPPPKPANEDERAALAWQRFKEHSR